jgi:putative cell wall-binding protein
MNRIKSLFLMLMLVLLSPTAFAAKPMRTTTILSDTTVS